MGTTTTHALPYPESSDLVTNGAAAIQALAEAVDDDLPRDTGLRDLTALTDAGFRSSYPASRVLARRVGDVVHIYVQVVEGAPTSAIGIIGTIGSTFPGLGVPEETQTGSHHAVGVNFANNNGQVGACQLLVRASDSRVDFAIYGCSTGSSHAAQLSYTTSDAWPAVLPGVAAP